MNRDYESMIRDYLIGKMIPEEREIFEVHFVDCRECIEDLLVTGALIEGLRVIEGERK